MASYAQTVEWIKAKYPNATQDQIRELAKNWGPSPDGSAGLFAGLKGLPTAADLRKTNLENEKRVGSRGNSIGEDLFDPGAEDRRDAGLEGEIAENEWDALRGRMPTEDDLTVDPSDFAYYSPADTYDYKEAIDALYDPRTGKTTSAYAGLDYKGPQTTGREAQEESLDFLDTLIANGGRDAVSDAYYEGQRSDAEQAARAQREAAQQNLEERGMDSGGLSLLAELMAARDVGTNANRAAMESSAMQQKRRDAANAARGSLGGQLYGQDMSAADAENSFGLNKAAGTDQWDQFFSEQLADQGRSKSTLLADEESKNTSTTQSAADKNVGVVNDALWYNAPVAQSMFENDLTVTSGKTGQLNTNALGMRDDARNAPSIAQEVIGFGGDVLSGSGKAKQLLSDDDDDEKTGKRK